MSATLRQESATPPPPAQSLSEPTRRQLTAFDVVRVALGLLLLTAAGMKLYGLSVTAMPRVGWFGTPRVQATAVAWEMVLGIWLLSGTAKRWAWLAAIGTFLTFSFVSGYFGWIGVASCGCFGALKTSPWTALSVDVGALLMLVTVQPIGHSSRARLLSWLPVVLPVVAPGLIVRVDILSISNSSNAGSAKGQMMPTEWVGKKLPISIQPEDVTSGVWLMMIHSQGCSSCETELPNFLSLSHSARKCLLSVSPSIPRPYWATEKLTDDRQLLWLRTVENTTISVATPSFLLLNRGFVVAVAQSVSEFESLVKDLQEP